MFSNAFCLFIVNVIKCAKITAANSYFRALLYRPKKKKKKKPRWNNLTGSTGMQMLKYCNINFEIGDEDWRRRANLNDPIKWTNASNWFHYTFSIGIFAAVVVVIVVISFVQNAHENLVFIHFAPKTISCMLMCLTYLALFMPLKYGNQCDYFIACH